MSELILLAKKNPAAPFAAMIVDSENGEVLCRGLNNSAANPTKHGEIVAIDNFAQLYPYRDYSKTILYTTAEPCPMCMSAIIWASVSQVVYGTSIPFLIQSGWGQIHIRAEEVSQKSASIFDGKILGGILKEKTNPLFADGPMKS